MVSELQILATSTQHLEVQRTRQCYVTERREQPMIYFLTTSYIFKCLYVTLYYEKWTNSLYSRILSTKNKVTDWKSWTHLFLSNVNTSWWWVFDEFRERIFLNITERHVTIWVCILQRNNLFILVSHSLDPDLWTLPYRCVVWVLVVA